MNEQLEKMRVSMQYKAKMNSPIDHWNAKTVIQKVREWLGDDGVNLFSSYKRRHGTVSPVFEQGGIPHPVHLREGMQVRNFLRRLKECRSWSDFDFDNRWAVIVEEAIKIE